MDKTSDKVLAFIGALVIAVSIVSIAVHDDVSAGEAVSNWLISIDDQQLSETESGNLQTGDSDTYDLDQDKWNVTIIVFTLTWNDDFEPDDEFELHVQEPNGTVSYDTPNPASDTSGTITITANVNPVPVPPASGYKGMSNDDARQKADEDFAHENGIGNWTVTVTLNSAQPIFLDGSNTYDLSITVNYYEIILANNPSSLS